MPIVEGLRSPYDKNAGGLHHLGRMLDKMRLKLAGRLPADFERNYGLTFGLDGILCGFLNVKFEDIEARVAQGGAHVGHDQLGVHVELGAEPVAGRAGAVGIVEGEQPGLDFGDGEARDRARELGREGGALAAVGVLGEDQPVADLESGDLPCT